MSNVVTLRSTFSAEAALARLDRELAEARRSRNEALRLREQMHRRVCQVQADIIRLEADREIALLRAGGTVSISKEEIRL